MHGIDDLVEGDLLFGPIQQGDLSLTNKQTPSHRSCQACGRLRRERANVEARGTTASTAHVASTSAKRRDPARWELEVAVGRSILRDWKEVRTSEIAVAVPARIRR